MKCSNCKDDQLYLHALINKVGLRYTCSACIVMDDTEFEKDNCYTELRDRLRLKHKRQG